MPSQPDDVRTLNVLGKSHSPGPELTLYYAGHEDCTPGHAWHCIRDHYLVHLVLSGKGRFWMDGREYRISTMEGFVIFPDVQARYQADDDEPWSYQWIGFSGTLATTHLARLGIDRAHPILSTADGKSIASCIDGMVKLGHGSSRNWYPAPSSEFMHRSLLYQFLHQLTLSRPERSSAQDRDYVHEAIRFIQGNYTRRVSMEETAAWLGLSRKYLSAIFKKTLGKSPKTYLCEYRLAVAERFLAEGTMSIKELALSSGFADELYFSRLFKQVYGDSPSAYRLRHTSVNRA